MKILLTGANGFIAKHLYDFLKKDGYSVDILHRAIADITNKDEVNNFFKDKSYKAVIHCASVGGNRNIPDAPDCVKNNLSMFYNLMEHQDKFIKFINLGSGAELDRNKNINSASSLQNCFPVDDYGLSKNIIARLGSQIDKFYNVRIFNVFSHEELETRMIKNNILNYINKRDIVIHQDRYMDFFYINDLFKVIVHILWNTPAHKTIDCSYLEKHKLSDIANKINNLSDYKVDIKILDQAFGKEYRGNPSTILNEKIFYDLRGLDYGLKMTYERLLEK
jgi:GDP-L-fucose synthase